MGIASLIKIYDCFILLKFIPQKKCCVSVTYIHLKFIFIHYSLNCIDKYNIISRNVEFSNNSFSYISVTYFCVLNTEIDMWPWFQIWYPRYFIFQIVLVRIHCTASMRIKSLNHVVYLFYVSAVIQIPIICNGKGHFLFLLGFIQQK
jgi:hypothetical protein